MIRQAIFDFDGTLADSKELVLATYNAMADRYGFRPILLAEVEELRRMSVPEKVRRLAVPLHRLPSLAAEFSSRYRGQAGSLAFVPGMKPLLRRLHAQGLELSVISSNSEENIRRFLRNNGANRLIRHIGSTPSLLGKGAMIRSFLMQRGVPREQSVYIGDEERDIQAARDAGVGIIAVGWGADAPGLLLRSRPDYLVRRPEEIAAILDRLNRHNRVKRL